MSEPTDSIVAAARALVLSRHAPTCLAPGLRDRWEALYEALGCDARMTVDEYVDYIRSGRRDGGRLLPTPVDHAEAVERLIAEGVLSEDHRVVAPVVTEEGPWRCEGCGWTNPGAARECDGCGEGRATARLDRAALLERLAS